MDKKIEVTLATLESHNHIIDDIERGIKIYNQGGVEFMENEPNLYLARVPHKGDFKTVSVSFTSDGQDLKHHFCDCTRRYSEPPVCRHVTAAVLAIQGGISKSTLAIGKNYWFESIVREEDTASCIGSGNLDVLSTPRLVTLMEHAAYMILEDELEDGQTSVGTNINICHTSASPVGITIEIEAKIISVKGRTITFEVSASDEAGDIGKGTHTRVIVDEERFMNKVNRKISDNGF